MSPSTNFAVYPNWANTEYMYVFGSNVKAFNVLSTFIVNVLNKQQYLVINSLKFDKSCLKSFSYHTPESIKAFKYILNKDRSLVNTAKFLKKAIFLQNLKTVWGLHTQTFTVVSNHPCCHGNNPNLTFMTTYTNLIWT